MISMPVDPVMDELGLPSGYLLHSGYQLKCSAPPADDGTAANHLIGTLTMNEGSTVDCIAVGNESHEGQFILEPDQENFPTTLKCQCGAGVTL